MKDNDAMLLHDESLKYLRLLKKVCGSGDCSVSVMCISVDVALEIDKLLSTVRKEKNETK